MMDWSLGIVTKIILLRDGVQEMETLLPSGENARALHYTDTFRLAQVGDQVLLNTTAMQLKLGTGGYHFVVAILDKDQKMQQQAIKEKATRGHMMKLRYTPLQRAVLAAEEEASPHHAVFLEEKNLGGMPVLIGELHSMLPIAAAWLRYRETVPLKIIYIMTDGGALPLSFSRHVNYLRRKEFINGTITYGNAFGGDLETLNKYTALIAAKHIMDADLAIVTMGPGIAGTGTPLGHMGVETGELINAVVKLGGTPVYIPRLSFADERDRHVGLSHHCQAVLHHVVAFPIELALPSTIKKQQRAYLEAQFQHLQRFPLLWEDAVTEAHMAEALAQLDIHIDTMGRGYKEDPAYFLGVGASAQFALDKLRSPKRGESNR